MAIDGRLLSAIAQPQNATTSSSLHSLALFSLVSPQQLVLVELLLPKSISLAYDLIFFWSFVWLRTFSIPAHLCSNLIFCATSLLSSLQLVVCTSQCLSAYSILYLC